MSDEDDDDNCPNSDVSWSNVGTVVRRWLNVSQTYIAAYVVMVGHQEYEYDNIYHEHIA